MYLLRVTLAKVSVSKGEHQYSSVFSESSIIVPFKVLPVNGPKYLLAL